ncbi:ABC transporter ATP-binding protein [Calycomorphotria hydatis]|uniref:Lipoprotein-releasing system ATP-binding protein LolD n=1 Tax=Calycomorphotria hydatis TaxID=2528027 RepID=A0A517T9K2_9PLAN|nr:ABC transporter ATP-binding protein [Calycomorphotria hydatis]QDT65055.1 Lipoprotein-releasing system ATP-binding protein LolD [Calycomorphotria hydatis]
MPLVEVHQLTKTFETGDESLTILQDLELSLEKGDAAVITGPSGSGKSTLLYIIGLLEQPTSGEVLLFGENPFEFSEPQQAKLRNDRIGFIFQDHHLLPQLTVLENVVLPLVAYRTVTSEDHQRAESLLERVGLSKRLKHRPAQLSGGERQRVALCRALINQPALLLADEPTGNLDTETAASVGTLLLELSKAEGTTLICVTHSVELASQFPKQFRLIDRRLQQQIDSPAH